MAKTVNIRWVAHCDLSAAHAAYVVATGAPCTDPKTEALLVGPVTEINNRLLSSSIDVGAFWKRYLSELLRDAEMSAACATALLSSGCSEMQIEQTAKAITGRLSNARSAFARRYPKLADQLALRAKPMRDKWDTFGQGLLRDVGRQVWGESPPDAWWPARIDARLVQPIRGGDGGFDSENERIWVEAMLTDVDPAVPEVLRVAWLITRMAIDTYTRDKSGDQRLATPWSLVSVPLVLTAAANLEILGSDRLPIARAMEVWQFGDAGVAEHLAKWWDVRRQSPAPLPASLKVLEQTLAGPPSVERSTKP